MVALGVVTGDFRSRTDMKTGEIEVADKAGVYVIKMSGDVRLNLSLSFDRFITETFAAPDFCSVIFDLSATEALDSTTLGLMAKISLKGRALDMMDPIVISTNPGITKQLENMGFGEILQIVESADIGHTNFKPLPESDLDETLMREKVLEAHRQLVELSTKNHETFKDLIQSLENIS